jgi:hypothetical protein
MDALDLRELNSRLPRPLAVYAEPSEKRSCPARSARGRKIVNNFTLLWPACAILSAKRKGSLGVLSSVFEAKLPTNEVV